jgi:hypothetical protein
MLKDKKKFKERYSKQMFHINTTQSSDTIQTAYLELNHNANKQLFSVNYNSSNMGITDKYASAVAATHNLLVMPTPANILVAFRPTSEFMSRLEDILGER